MERNTHLNIRLSQDEKNSWLEAAQQLGYGNLSDFVRVVLTEKAKETIGEASQ